MAACGGGDDGAGTATNQPSPPVDNAQPPANNGGTPTSPSPGTTNSAPTISGTPPPAVLIDTPYSFQPEAIDADGDILTFSIANPPPWAVFEAATGKLAGTPGAGDIGAYDNIVINVTDGADDAQLTAFSINVAASAGGSVELSWVPPTENTDGTPLTDLAGYKIYWGTTAGDYSNSVTINNPGLATYVLENLVPATYFFVATAVNASGEESAPSQVASGTIS